MEAGLRRIHTAVVTLALTFVPAGCRSATRPPADAQAPVGRLGAPAGTFGIQPSTGPGGALSPSGLEIRWDDVKGDRVAVGIAELWSPERQAEFVAGTPSIRALADDYARRLGAPDARFVSAGLAGGIEFVHYRSASLRSAMAGAADPALRGGRFFVAVNLDPHSPGLPTPVASNRADPASTHGRLFTVAVMSGRPWADGVPADPESANGPPPAPVESVAVVVQESAYRPSVLSARAGRPLVVSLSNRDGEAHDFIVPDLPSPVHLFMTAHKDVVSSLTFPAPGEYVFYCSLRTHRARGMEGRVVVGP
jgi:plastocyanin